jgi:hypothetical protein
VPPGFILGLNTGLAPVAGLGASGAFSFLSSLATTGGGVAATGLFF